jgi:type IV pilus assembly protein PilV
VSIGPASHDCRASRAVFAVGAANTRQQSGVSLIEVLVAVVLLSIGLLGLAGLQASGMRVGQSSIHRSQAAQLAHDMIERMRANVADAGAYNLGLDDAAPACASAAACDLRDWRLRLQALPAGIGAVTVSGRQATVLVQWDDSRGAGVLRGSAADDAARTQLRSSQFQITAQLAN